MKTARWLLFAGLLALPCPVAGLGMAEDPQERLTRSWLLEAVRTLEIRGEVQFELVPGAERRVTVETTRALFDQLNVSSWFGSATVAIESGLRGPREDGSVKVIIELPSLVGLTVLDRSSGTVRWPPGAEARLRVGEASAVDLVFEGDRLIVEASWQSAVTLRGRAEDLTIVGRHQSRLDARNLAVASARVTLDERSSLEAGTGWTASGTARHGSRVGVPEGPGWEALKLREGAVLDRLSQTASQ